MTDPNRWYFSKQKLMNSPSRRCGLDEEKEVSYRQGAANFIQDMGQRLQVTQLCINTAIVYMQRFYMFHSFTKFHRYAIAACALFLAAKVEEQPRKLEHVIKVAYWCLNIKPNKQGAQLDVKSPEYIRQANELVVNENIMLQTLGFEIAIEHPHTSVVKCCQLVKADKDLAQTSYFMATSSLHLTTMCLQYKPTVVACFCIHIACKWDNWEIPASNEGKPWFCYVDKTVTEEMLESLTSEFLSTFEKLQDRFKKPKHKNPSNHRSLLPSLPNNLSANSDKKSSTATSSQNQEQDAKRSNNNNKSTVDKAPQPSTSRSSLNPNPDVKKELKMEFSDNSDNSNQSAINLNSLPSLFMDDNIINGQLESTTSSSSTNSSISKPTNSKANNFMSLFNKSEDQKPPTSKLNQNINQNLNLNSNNNNLVKTSTNNNINSNINNMNASLTTSGSNSSLNHSILPQINLNSTNSTSSLSSNLSNKLSSSNHNSSLKNSLPSSLLPQTNHNSSLTSSLSSSILSQTNHNSSSLTNSLPSSLLSNQSINNNNSINQINANLMQHTHQPPPPQPQQLSSQSFSMPSTSIDANGGYSSSLLNFSNSNSMSSNSMSNSAINQTLNSDHLSSSMSNSHLYSNMNSFDMAPQVNSFALTNHLDQTDDSYYHKSVKIKKEKDREKHHKKHKSKDKHKSKHKDKSKDKDSSSKHSSKEDKYSSFELNRVAPTKLIIKKDRTEDISNGDEAVKLKLVINKSLIKPNYDRKRKQSPKENKERLGKQIKTE